MVIWVNLDVFCVFAILFMAEFWLIKEFPNYLFHLHPYLLFIICMFLCGFSCGHRLFSWGLGLPKSCRQVDFLFLPIWMGSYPWKIFPLVVKSCLSIYRKTLFTTEEYLPGKPALLPTGTSVSSRFWWY